MEMLSDKPGDYSPGFASSSSDTFKAAASFKAVDILQSSRLSMSSMVRIGTSESFARAGTDSPRARRICFNCNIYDLLDLMTVARVKMLKTRAKRLIISVAVCI